MILLAQLDFALYNRTCLVDLYSGDVSAVQFRPPQKSPKFPLGAFSCLAFFMLDNKSVFRKIVSLSMPHAHNFCSYQLDSKKNH